jgi:uncharacterized membrane protein
LADSALAAGPAGAILRGMTGAASPRIRSVDVMRGVVMVLMAIDHVRVYSGVPAGGPTPGIFFTRWVTHFCAPAFVFFAGTGAFLYRSAAGGAASVARFLVTRGALLVVLELTLIKFFWTFHLDYSTFVLAGVIWMLGWSMMLLAPLIRFSARTVGIVGVAIVVGQQLFGLIPRAIPEPARGYLATVWNFIYPTGDPGWPLVSVLYVIVPWIGVMAAGYGFGAILRFEPERRRRWCLRIGLAMTVAFVAIAGVVVALQHPDNGPPWWVRMLGQQKYPASQVFLLMTLGPTIALLPLADRTHGWLSNVFETFGRVPMFYYLLHIPTIHIAAVIADKIRGHFDPRWFATAPFTSVPASDRWSLSLLYLVFGLVVALLYPLCRWYANAKARRRTWWMRLI